MSVLRSRGRRLPHQFHNCPNCRCSRSDSEIEKEMSKSRPGIQDPARAYEGCVPQFLLSPKGCEKMETERMETERGSQRERHRRGEREREREGERERERGRGRGRERERERRKERRVLLPNFSRKVIPALPAVPARLSRSLRLRMKYTVLLHLTFSDSGSCIL